MLHEREDGSFLGAPPYYVVAYELHGMVTVSEIGSQAANLSWLVNHRAGAYLYSVILWSHIHTLLGSNLLVNVVDSQGRSGGVSSAYTVQGAILAVSIKPFG